MRAAVCRDFHAPVTIEEIEVPPLRPGTVRIRIRVAAANPPDVLMSRGTYQVRPERPFVIGVEGAGVVDAVADDVADFRVGDRVMTYAGQGCYAEQVVVAAHLVHPIPAGMSFEIAAGFCLVYGTAYHALIDRGAVTAGETVAVLGAAGGIGLCAIQIAKAVGAQVIAVASTPEKLAICREHGADAGVPTGVADLKDRLRALSGGAGVHAVLDPVGGPLTLAALRGLRPYGRHLVVGYSSGEIPQIPANYVLLKQVSVVGVSFRQCAQDVPDVARNGIRTLLRLWSEGALRPLVSGVHPLDRFEDALAFLSSRSAIGKHVVSVSA